MKKIEKLTETGFVVFIELHDMRAMAAVGAVEIQQTQMRTSAVVVCARIDDIYEREKTT